MYRHSRLRSRIAQSLHGLCAVLPVLLLATLLAPAAHAQSSAPLQCGLYEYDGGRGQMRVLSSNLIRKSALNGPELPQGTFKRPIGTLRKLVFGADGVVKDDGSLTMKARREGGLIKMQHNQGGDFVLKPLGDRLLLGVDYWNRLALFVRADN